VLINSDQGVIQLDSNGNASTPVANLANATPFDMGSWVGAVSGELAGLWEPEGSNGITNALAASDFPSPQGDVHGQQKQPPRCSPNRLNCVLAPISDNYNGTAQNPAPERDITYGVFSLKNGTLTDIHNQQNPFEIVLREQTTPQNSDDNHVICNGPGGCSNRDANQGSYYNEGEFEDALIEIRNGVTLSVSQNFFVERMRAAVYWPQVKSGQYTWYGATNQTANTTTTSARITQTPPLSSAAVCGFIPYTGDVACDPTGP
jgi:hypothetical protein